MELSRREFLELFSKAALATGLFPSSVAGGAESLVSAEAGLGLKPVFMVEFLPATSFTHTALRFADLAHASTAPVKRINDIGRLIAARKDMQACPEDNIRKLLVRRQDVIAWCRGNYNEDAAALVQQGFDNVVRYMHMPDADFDRHCKQLQQKLKARHGGSKAWEDPELPQRVLEELRHLLERYKNDFVIRWDTIKNATTPRIRITVDNEARKPYLILLGEALADVAPYSSVKLNGNESRIIIRNPSHALREVLRPYTLQKHQRYLPGTREIVTRER